MTAKQPVIIVRALFCVVCNFVIIFASESVENQTNEVWFRVDKPFVEDGHGLFLLSTFDASECSEGIYFVCCFCVDLTDVGSECHVPYVMPQMVGVIFSGSNCQFKVTRACVCLGKTSLEMQTFCSW